MTKTTSLARRWLGILSGWTLFALFNGLQTGMTRLTGGRIQWQLIYGFSGVDALVWLVLTPLILWIASRLSPSRRRLALVVPAQFALGIAFALLHLKLITLLLPMIGYRAPRNLTLFAALLPTRLQFDLLTYWLLVGILYAIDYYRQFRERQLHASQLETALAHARLEVLRAQLQPHFLFNTLNSISSLMYKDVPAADRVLQRLAGFLRLALETAKSQEVCLETELEYADRYLDIEQVRFSDRLTVQREIQPEVREALVPTLILQPFVENAVRHGVGTHARGGRIWIRARRQDDRLLMEVEDEGHSPETVQEGIGLANARSRLATLYGDRQRLSVGPGPSGGFRVAVELPFRTGEPR